MVPLDALPKINVAAITLWEIETVFSGPLRGVWFDSFLFLFLLEIENGDENEFG